MDRHAPLENSVVCSVFKAGGLRVFWKLGFLERVLKLLINGRFPVFSQIMDENLVKTNKCPLFDDFEVTINI